ncbi:PEP-CTERM sorting domain-containing protein [Aeoliella mucimassa]|uniref:PEP-CTERM motif protein n=1 Tax=Aeoliella mucimassa TaxID=2527972 RepID=A0A518AKP6_9BACT|nr:PEP-CTERM sorting domain-containing protein [Aeoliella mucimassa]QDU55291.1 PEP-CTERM motif protein [Aeoliella mucimassa]
MTRPLTTFCAVLASLCLGVSSASAAVLYSDSMESGAGWGINAFGDGDHAATFGYDYSADDIPEAPHSQVGDSATTGVKLEANTASDSAGSSGFTLYPVGQSFTGSYQLRFDAWINYDANERINGNSDGTTEFIGGGIGYDGVKEDIGSGAQLIVTGDGGSSNDYRAFGDTNFLDAAEMAGLSRDGGNVYYADFLPGVAPPAGQSQTAFPAGTPGTPGFQWVTFEFTTDGTIADVIMEKPGGERLLIASINASGNDPFSSDGNISLFYADFFSSVTAEPGLTFGMIDNVVVTQVPEPTTLALLGLGLGGLMLYRRR